MKFSEALEHLYAERRIARASWPRGSFVVMMPSLYLPPFNTADTFRKVNDRTAKWIGEDTPLDCQPYLAYFDGERKTWQPGWLPSTDDLFHTNWWVFAADMFPAEAETM